MAARCPRLPAGERLRGRLVALSVSSRPRSSRQSPGYPPASARRRPSGWPRGAPPGSSPPRPCSPLPAVLPVPWWRRPSGPPRCASAGPRPCPSSRSPARPPSGRIWYPAGAPSGRKPRRHPRRRVAARRSWRPPQALPGLEAEDPREPHVGLHGEVERVRALSTSRARRHCSGVIGGVAFMPSPWAVPVPGGGLGLADRVRQFNDLKAVAGMRAPNATRSRP